ncbi:hypothetical protein DFH06DRAFT_1364188 [Mycena polygramma]|nr:hypothetical protein DFH06DRAFT_1364188 [Mycena polygramma]
MVSFAALKVPSAPNVPKGFHRKPGFQIELSLLSSHRIRNEAEIHSLKAKTWVNNVQPIASRTLSLLKQAKLNLMRNNNTAAALRFLTRMIRIMIANQICPPRFERISPSLNLPKHPILFDIAAASVAPAIIAPIENFETVGQKRGNDGETLEEPAPKRGKKSTTSRSKPPAVAARRNLPQFSHSDSAPRTLPRYDAPSI